MFRKLVLVGMLLGVSPAWSSVTLMGNLTCGRWVENRKEDGFPSALSTAWLAGYVSGLAAVSGSHFLRVTDSESMHLWTDKYCHENPLDSVADAANALMFELIARMPKK